MMKILLSALFSILFTISSFSQKYSYGKISQSELEEKQSSIEPEAPAEIIYKDVFLAIDLHGQLEIQVTERIKVYQKDRAEEFLTYEVPLHKSGSSLEKLSGFRGSTYNLENGKMVEVKIKSDQTFTEEKHKYKNLFKFTFPDVRDGSILEYKYTIYSPFMAEIPVQYFDYKIPLRYMNYAVKVPSIFYYIPDMRGLNAGKVKTEKETQDVPGEYPYAIVKLKIENVKSYEEEPFVLNYQNIRTSIRYELAKVEIPGQTVKNYASTWEKVGTTLLNSDDFGSYYNNTHQFKDVLPTVLAGATTDNEKAKAILKYVQENYVWNEYLGVFADQGLGKVIKTKTGNSGDLNLLLVAMLREARIDANPIVLSTVSNGIINYTFPSLQKLNYVIAGYYSNSELNILDATSKYSEVNQVPKRVLNYRGFYIKKNNIHEVDLSNKTMSSDIFLLNYEIKPDLECVGTMVNRSTQYFGMTKIEQYRENKSQFEKDFKNKYSFPLENLEFSQNKSIFKSSFGFNSVSNAEKVGNKLVFNPLVFLSDKEQVFKAEKRTYPIELGSPVKLSKITIITLPEGYKVETLPTSKKFLIEGNLGSYSYIIRDKGKQIELTTELIMNEFFIPADYYEVLKEFWQHMIETESQLVSLIKG